MTADDLNALVSQAYAAAFAYETELEQVYRRAFRRASRHAARTFKATAITAAGFVPPPVDTLTTGLTEKEQAQADKVRDKAAAAVAAALIALGLTAVAASFLQVISARGALNFEQELLRTLRTVVAKGLAEGWTADQTAVAIQEAFTNVVAVLWPTPKAQAFLTWAGEPNLLRRRNGTYIEERSDDAMGGRWMRTTRQRVVATIPSLVEHPDDAPSTIARRPGGRTALFWHGVEWDAASVEWD